MARVIKDDATLREYIPNVIGMVDDERSLYAKLRPEIELAEGWLEENLTGSTMLDKIAAGGRDARYEALATAIVSRSFAAGIPQLDLVLTPNGFGIVSNANVAPASKERIERLIVTLQRRESESLTMLLRHLRRDSDWHNSEQCRWLAKSIIQDLNLATKFGNKNGPYEECDTDRWGVFLTLRQKAYDIEAEIANGWISPQLMARLRECEATATYSEETGALVSFVKGVVCTAIRTGELNRKLLDDAVTYIRAYPDLFPEWHSSETAKLFAPPIFANAKGAGGYFF